MSASGVAHHAIANAIDDDRTLSLFGYTRAAHALAVVMPDGRSIGQWLDALAALEAACREAPWIWSRHAEAAAHPGECRLCGHSWPCPSERIRHLLPEARP